MTDPLATLRAAVEAHDGPRCGELSRPGWVDTDLEPCELPPGHDGVHGRENDPPSWDALRGVLEAADALVKERDALRETLDTIAEHVGAKTRGASIEFTRLLADEVRLVMRNLRDAALLNLPATQPREK